MHGDRDAVVEASDATAAREDHAPVADSSECYPGNRVRASHTIEEGDHRRVRVEPCRLRGCGSGRNHNTEHDNGKANGCPASGCGQATHHASPPCWIASRYPDLRTVRMNSGASGGTPIFLRTSTTCVSIVRDTTPDA